MALMWHAIRSDEDGRWRRVQASSGNWICKREDDCDVVAATDPSKMNGSDVGGTDNGD